MLCSTLRLLTIFMHRKPSRIRETAHILAVTQDREKLTVFAPAKVAQHTGDKVHHLRYKALGQRNVLQKNQIAYTHGTASVEIYLRAYLNYHLGH